MALPLVFTSNVHTYRNNGHFYDILDACVRPEKFQFLEKGQNRNFDYKIVISVKNP